MAGVKRASTSICFLRDDERLKQAAMARLLSKGWTRNKLATEVGIVPFLLSNWLNSKRPYPSQWDVIRMCTRLGLKVDLKVSIDYDEV